MCFTGTICEYIMGEDNSKISLMILQSLMIVLHGA